MISRSYSLKKYYKFIIYALIHSDTVNINSHIYHILQRIDNKSIKYYRYIDIMSIFIFSAVLLFYIKIKGARLSIVPSILCLPQWV